MKTTEIFRTDGDYAKYRIPGMIVTEKGTKLLYCEARKTPDDWSLMDILLTRIEKGEESPCGRTVLAKGNETHRTVNNPVMAQGKNGRIHFLYCEDYSIKGGRVLYRFSDDDGISWSEARDITPATLPDYRNAFALGPGHGIVKKDGTVLFPVWLVPKRFGEPEQAHIPSEIGALYSLDGGAGWQTGELLGSEGECLVPGETVFAELDDGTVYLNCRLCGDTHFRGRAYSKNGYSDWYGYEPDTALPDPVCFGSCAADGRGNLFFVNCASQTERINVTLKRSTDGGKSWCKSLTVNATEGGYAEVAAADGTVYVFYETDFGASCRLATIGETEYR